jgi:hypothetical protein
MPSLQELLERFHQSYAINQSTQCWVWQKGKSAGRYGAFYQNAKAHRWSYEQFVGPIADGMVVCHRCDNGLCVNPSHLWTGTQADNVADMIAKGRDRKYFGPRPWIGKFGDDNVSRKYIERMPRGAQVNTCKLSEDQVREIRRRYSAGGTSFGKLAAEYAVSKFNIACIIKRKTWKHLNDSSMPIAA